MKEEKTTIHVIRLLPGQDLKKSLEDYVNEQQIEAAWIVTTVGSLTGYCLRFANKTNPARGEGHFEILNLSGTLAKSGTHLHLTIADAKGRGFGGHLLAGCRIYTTAEIVIQEGLSLRFNREADGTTPWKELSIDSREG